MSRLTGGFVVLAALGALLGVVNAAVSAGDFAAHLDRQIHPVSCSLVPVLAAPPPALEAPGGAGEEAATGCKVAMQSPYSSFWRDRYWGGIPVALFALGLYAFILALGGWGLVSRRAHDLAPSTFLVIAALAAAGGAGIYAYIAVSKLGTVCQTCAGMYLASAVTLIGAVAAAITASRDRRLLLIARGAEDGDVPPPRGLNGLGSFAVLTVEMGLAVLGPPAVYASSLPDYDKHVLDCERLKTRDDPKGLLLPLPSAGDADAVLVLDPLCPACKAFHETLGRAVAAKGLDERMLLLPLDAECNWMLKDSLHPGACLVSKALICAGPRAGELLEDVFRQQEDLRSAGRGRKMDRIRDALLAKMPEIRQCLDAPETEIRLNETLRWAVDNALPVITPQLYVDGKRLCDEDTDLGLEYALGRLMGPHGGSGDAAGGAGQTSDEGAAGVEGAAGAPAGGAGGSKRTEVAP